MGTFIGHATLLEETSKFGLRRVWVISNHKPWFDEECSELVDLGKQAELQWM
jgi:hypothetical protein